MGQEPVESWKRATCVHKESNVSYVCADNCLRIESKPVVCREPAEVQEQTSLSRQQAEGQGQAAFVQRAESKPPVFQEPAEG